jgi:hypothetical protein
MEGKLVFLAKLRNELIREKILYAMWISGADAEWNETEVERVDEEG